MLRHLKPCCLSLLICCLGCMHNAQCEEAAASGAWIPPGSALVVEALSLLGTPYRYSGESPEGGFDCSGLVAYLFKDALGQTIPHSAAELFHRGVAVQRADLQAGDLVFFNLHGSRAGVSHVALYIGNDQFVHAPTTGAMVRIEQLSSAYWQHAYRGGRRLFPENLALQLPQLAAGADQLQ